MRGESPVGTKVGRVKYNSVFSEAMAERGCVRGNAYKCECPKIERKTSPRLGRVAHGEHDVAVMPFLLMRHVVELLSRHRLRPARWAMPAI